MERKEFLNKKKNNVISKTDDSSTFGFWKILCLYLPIVIISMIIRNQIVDTPYLTTRMNLHQQMITGNGLAPMQYRILIYWLAEIFIRMGISFKITYLFLGTFFTLTSVILLHYFIKRWCETKVCIIGGLFFLAILPFTYLHCIMQDMDISNLFFFLIGYILIEQRRDVWFALLLFVAMLNRETPVLLPIVWLFYRYDELEFKTLIIRFLLFCGITVGVYTLLRTVYGMLPYYSLTSYLTFNSKHIKSYVYTFLFFGYPLWYMIFNRQNKSIPKFLQRAVFFIPFFISIHWTMTVIEEVRLWLPILPLIFASGLILIFGTGDKIVHMNYSAITSPVMNRYKRFFYWIILGIFIVGLWGFYKYNQNHLKNLDNNFLSRIFFHEGNYYLVELGYAKDAEEQFLKAESLNPNNPEINYYLGLLYFQYLPNKEKAFKYLNRVKSLETDTELLSKVQGMIERLK